VHNLFYFTTLLERLRAAIAGGTFEGFRRRFYEEQEASADEEEGT
jgi:queuine/archaeosine tRNA-ribosyltransferase